MNFRAADESTEMLLTDYLEGRLDPSRKAEIDTYLNKHPRERQVIEQLRAQRQLLGALPEEKAPADIYEAVAGQLERSMLLSSLAEIESEKTGSVRSRPQRLALAAVVLLSMGLGVVIYAIVSGPSQPGELKVLVARGLDADSGRSGDPARQNPPTSVALNAQPAPLASAHVAMSDSIRSGVRNDNNGPKPELFDNAIVSEPFDSQKPMPMGLVDRLKQKGVAGGTDAPVAAAPPAASHAQSQAALVSAPQPSAKSASAGETVPDADPDNLPVYRVNLVSSNPRASQARLEQFLRAGGWSYLAPQVSPQETPPAADENSVTGKARRMAPPAAVMERKVEPTPDTNKDTEPAQEKRSELGVATTRPSSPATPQTSTRLLVRVEADQLDALRAALTTVMQSSTTPDYLVDPEAVAGSGPADRLRGPAVPSSQPLARAEVTGPGAVPGGRMVNLLIIISPNPTGTTVPPTTQPTTLP